jgi:hypothetical protein
MQPMRWESRELTIEIDAGDASVYIRVQNEAVVARRDRNHAMPEGRAERHIERREILQSADPCRAINKGCGR